MKSILFTILLLLSPLAVSQGIPVPEQCVPEVQMTMFVMDHYHKGIPKDEFLAFVHEQHAAHPEITDEATAYALELVELVYGVQPDSNEDAANIYKLVIERCVYEKSMGIAPPMGV